MNPENLEKKTFKNILKANIRPLAILFTILILAGAFFLWLDYNNKNKRIKISENFIEAKVLLANNNYNGSLQILNNIVREKDRIYSPLSLFLIIDKNLEKDKKTILKHFDTVLSIGGLEKEDLNLIRLKKTIFISDFSEEQSVLDLLNPIINSNSVWKIQSLKFLGDYYFSLKQFKKAEQYYSVILKEKDLNVDTSEIKRKMKLIQNG